MLTPQEIQDKKFEKALLGGYDMSQVDNFLDKILADYTSLYKENATLKSKMRVLVDKVEEYRAVDDQMRKALYNAQITAKEIETRAQQEADSLMQQTRDNAAAAIRDLQTEIERENRRLEQARQLCDEYGRRMQTILRTGSEELAALLSKPSEEIGGPDQPEAPEIPDIPQPAPAQEPQPEPQEEGEPREEGEDGGIELPDFSDRKPGQMKTSFYEVEMKDDLGVSEDKLRMFAPKPRFDFSTLNTDNDTQDKERK